MTRRLEATRACVPRREEPHYRVTARSVVRVTWDRISIPTPTDGLGIRKSSTLRAVARVATYEVGLLKVA